MFHSHCKDNQSQSNAQCDVPVQNQHAFDDRVPRDVDRDGIPRGADKHGAWLHHHHETQPLHGLAPSIHGRPQHRVLHARPVLLRSMVSRMPNGDAENSVVLLSLL